MATTSEERDLLNAFSSISQDLLSRTTPPFVRNLLGPPQGPMNGPPAMPTPKLSTFGEAQQAGMPANLALNVAAESAREGAEGDARRLVDAEQSTREKRSKSAAEALLREFPEVIFGLSPLRPYSDAVKRYAEEFGVGVEEIKRALTELGSGRADSPGDLPEELQDEALRGKVLVGQSGPFIPRPIPPSPFGHIESIDEGIIPFMMPKPGEARRGQRPGEIPGAPLTGADAAAISSLPGVIPSFLPSPGAEQLPIGSLVGQSGPFFPGAPIPAEEPPEAIYPPSLSGGPLAPVAKILDSATVGGDDALGEPAAVPTAWEEPFMFGSRFEGVGLPIGVPVPSIDEAVGGDDALPIEEVEPYPANTKEQELYELMAGYGNLQEDDPFKGFADPSAAAFESVARGFLGQDAYRPEYMAAIKRGQTHSMGSFWLQNMLDPQGTRGRSYYDFLTKGKHMDPKRTQQVYDSIVRASAAAYQSDSFTDWAKGTEGYMNDEQIRAIGQMVRENPEFELYIVAAQEGITGKGYFGNHRLRALYSMKDYYDKRAIRDPDAPSIGFAAWWEKQKKNRFDTAAPTPAAAPAAAPTAFLGL